MAVQSFQSWVPPSTDTSFGTHTGNLPVAPVARSYSSVTRTQLTAPNPTQVEIGGFTTSKEAAYAAGLIAQPDVHSVPVATHEGAHYEVAHREREGVANREAQKETAVYDQFNAGFDEMESAFESREDLQEFTDLVIAGDEEAVNSVDPRVVAGYYHEADQLAKAVGLPHSRGLTFCLTEDDRQAALAALISNRHSEFSQFCRKAYANAQNLHLDTDFQEACSEAGYEIVGKDVVVDGQLVSIARMALEGRMSFD